ncbi:MAG: tetratricopeptide repeat protein [Deltaproteobacteria bacterium]|nr:tetratricopeptide repeat protein [Deltaproteobacteria bacterium]
MNEQLSAQPDIFVSYNSQDLAIAERLWERLVAAGFGPEKIWFDRIRLQPGFNWYEKIKAGCENSRVILPVLTPRWKQSQWTKFETYSHDRVVPLLFEGQLIVNKADGKPDWNASVATPPLARFQAHTIDLRDHPDQQWSRLLDAIRVLLEQPPAVRKEEGDFLQYPPPSIFVGREDKLNEIHEKLFQLPTADLTQGRIQVVSGTGGMGKTTLARVYPEKFWRLYQGMFWVDCRQDIVTQFARIFDALFPDRASQPQDDNFKAPQALDELKQRRPHRRLLILDDAESYDAIKAWLPKTGNCHTIITTRYAIWPEALAKATVDVLDPEPSRELLLRTADRSWDDSSATERTSCDHLADRLGYLPLALKQAAAYVHAQQDPSFGFRDYLHLYEQAEAYYLQQHTFGETDYPKSVYATWRTTIEKLSGQAQAILRLAAFMADTPIPNDVFSKATDIVQERADPLGGAAPGPTAAPGHAEVPPEGQFRKWRAELLSYSMMSASADGALSVHGLVQAVERDTTPDDQRPRWIEQAMTCLTRLTWSDQLRYEEWALWFKLLPHAQTLCNRAEKDSRVQQNAELLYDLGEVLYNRGQYAMAVECAKRAYDVFRTTKGEDEPFTLAAGHNFGGFLMMYGRYAEAEPILRNVVSARERVLGQDHKYTLRSVYTLATLLNDKGEYTEAELLCRRALEAQERVLGPEHPDTLSNVNTLANLLMRKEEYTEAELLYRRALEARERVLGSDHPDTLSNVHNLASLLNSNGKYTEAEPLYRRAFEAQERVLGSEHPDTLTTVSNLAFLLDSKGEYAEAELLYRRALEAQERVLGSEHPDTLASVNNLAVLLKSKGEYTEAEPLYRRALEAQERVLGSEHPDTLASVNNLAVFLQNKGEYTEAEPLYRRALEVRERVLGPEHPNTLSTVTNLASLLDRKGEYAEAEPLFRRTLQAKEGTPQAEHPQFALDLNNFALLLRKLKRFDEAAGFLRQAIELEERLLPAEHPNRAHRRNNLAIVLMLAGQFEAAARANAEAWHLKATVSQGGHDMTSARILFVRIALYCLTGSDAAICLGQLRSLLQQPDLPCYGGIQAIWQIEDVIADLREKLASDQAELLAALVAALNDRERVGDLDRFPMWRDHAAVPLDQPWAELPA